MSLGTKNRLTQMAAACKQHLREHHKDKLALVNEFIAEFEGDDPTSWNKLSDAKRSESEMLLRVDEAFESWLNP